MTKPEVLPDLEKFESRSPEVPAVQQDGFLATIERLAIRTDIDPDKIQKFLDMQERILDRSEKQEFNAAMTRAQGKIELVAAKSWNDQTKSHYAKLKDVLIKAKPIYTEEGFSLMFYEGENAAEGKKRVCVDILHSAGHTKKRHVDLTVTTKGTGGTTFMTQIHGEGSVFSYGRRYLTCMVFNIPTGDDDDGNAAGAGNQKFITPEQVESLTADINKYYGGDVSLVLQYLQAGSIETVTPAQCATVAQWIKGIEAGKAERAAKKQDREPGAEG